MGKIGHLSTLHHRCLRLDAVDNRAVWRGHFWQETISSEYYSGNSSAKDRLIYRLIVSVATAQTPNRSHQISTGSIDKIFCSIGFTLVQGDGATVFWLARVNKYRAGCLLTILLSTNI
jgi:hypothetical protein